MIQTYSVLFSLLDTLPLLHGRYERISIDVSSLGRKLGQASGAVWSRRQRVVQVVSGVDGGEISETCDDNDSFQMQNLQ